MKGPGLRIDNDVRRLWQCPACGQTLRAGGEVVFRRCNCRGDGFMQLKEGLRRVRQFEVHAAAAESFAARCAEEAKTASGDTSTLNATAPSSIPGDVSAGEAVEIAAAENSAAEIAVAETRFEGDAVPPSESSPPHDRIPDASANESL